MNWSMNAQIVLVLRPRDRSGSFFFDYEGRGRGRERRCWSGRAQAAFTLIELMVVIALIGILSAMIIPEMRGTYEEALLRSTSRQLVNLCNLANSQAVSAQQIHRVRLDLPAGRFMLEKRERRAKRGEGFVPVEGVSGSHGELDHRISVVVRPRSENQNQSENSDSLGLMTTGVAEENSPEGQVGMTFYPDGTADAEDIQLRDRQGFRLLLRLSPVTARVRVVELPRE
jgi:type II secretion system protein H